MENGYWVGGVKTGGRLLTCKGSLNPGRAKQWKSTFSGTQEEVSGAGDPKGESHHPRYYKSVRFHANHCELSKLNGHEHYQRIGVKDV